MNMNNINNFYYYKIYNLNVKSDIDLPELNYNKYEFLPNIDVNITLGSCPKMLENIKVSNEYYTLNENEAMFERRECGKFYIEKGTKIIIEPIKNANYEHLKAFIYGRSFAVLLFQRNTLALHGNSVVLDDEAFIFCGSSGAGKSTLSTALTLKGYTMLSDDLSVINFTELNKPVVCPGLINNKLCVDTINYFNLNKNMLVKVDEYADKYALAPLAKSFKTSKKLTNIVELEVDYKNTDHEVTIKEIYGEEKLQTIFKNVFRMNLLTDIGLKPQYLKNCLNAAKNIRIFNLTRPNGKFTLDDQINLIEKIKC